MGFWGKGNNPFWNFDSDAAQRDREAHRASESAHKEKLAHELDLQNQRLNGDAALSKLRIQKNAMEAQYNDKIKAYEAQIEEMRKAFYCLVIRSCIFERTFNNHIAKHPEQSDELLDNLQIERDHCTSVDFREKWWKWVHEVEINYNMEYVRFPYPKRELKKESDPL